MTNPIEDLLYGSGRCKCCGKFEPLAIVAMPGLSIDEETGEIVGEGVIDPNDRTGYCKSCFIKMAKGGQFDSPPPN